MNVLYAYLITGAIYTLYAQWALHFSTAIDRKVLSYHWLLRPGSTIALLLGELLSNLILWPVLVTWGLIRCIAAMFSITGGDDENA